MGDGVDEGDAGQALTGPGSAWEARPASKPAAGWYLDPWDRAQHRFWNGESWTAETFPNGPARAQGADFGVPAWPASSSANADWEPRPTGEATESGPWVPLAPSTATVPPPDWAQDPDLTSPGTRLPPLDQAGAPSGEDSRLPSGRALAAIALVVGLVLGFLAALGIVAAVDRHPKAKRSAAAVAPLPAPTIPPNVSILPATPAQPTPTLPTGRATPTDPSAAALNSLVLRQADVASTVTVQTLPGDDSVAGAPTLDLCNGTFPSESLRTARLQTTGFDVQGNRVLSTEAVLYSSPAATAQAFSELRKTAANCPATPVTSPVGDPTVTTRFNAAPDGTWPQTPTVERLAYDFVITDETGQTEHAVTAYLRRGRVLMGVYFLQPDGAQVGVAGQTTISGIVGVFAARIAQVPASVVNGG